MVLVNLEDFKNRCTRKKQEAIKLLYRNNDLLYVSIHSLHKISKYNSKEGTAQKFINWALLNGQRLKVKQKPK